MEPHILMVLPPMEMYSFTKPALLLDIPSEFNLQYKVGNLRYIFLCVSLSLCVLASNVQR